MKYVVALLGPRKPSGLRSIETRWEYSEPEGALARFAIAVAAYPRREIILDQVDGVCRAGLATYHGERLP